MKTRIQKITTINTEIEDKIINPERKIPLRKYKSKQSRKSRMDTRLADLMRARGFNPIDLLKAIAKRREELYKKLNHPYVYMTEYDKYVLAYILEVPIGVVRYCCAEPGDQIYAMDIAKSKARSFMKERIDRVENRIKRIDAQERGDVW